MIIKLKNGNYKEYFEGNTYPRGRKSIKKLEKKCMTKDGKTLVESFVNLIH